MATEQVEKTAAARPPVRAIATGSSGHSRAPADTGAGWVATTVAVFPLSSPARFAESPFDPSL